MSVQPSPIDFMRAKLVVHFGQRGDTYASLTLCHLRALAGLYDGLKQLVEALGEGGEDIEAALSVARDALLMAQGKTP